MLASPSAFMFIASWSGSDIEPARGGRARVAQIQSKYNAGCVMTAVLPAQRPDRCSGVGSIGRYKSAPACQCQQPHCGLSSDGERQTGWGPEQVRVNGDSQGIRIRQSMTAALRLQTEFPRRRRSTVRVGFGPGFAIAPSESSEPMLKVRITRSRAVRVGLKEDASAAC